MDNETKLEAIKWWQTAGYFHPLTCKDSKHEILVGFLDNNVVKLKCVTCDYVQEHIPDVVFGIYDDRHKIEGLHNELRNKSFSEKQGSSALLAPGKKVHNGSECNGVRS